MTRDEELALIDEAIATGKLTRVSICSVSVFDPQPSNIAIGRKNGRRKNGRNQSAKIREIKYRELGI